MKHKIKDSKIVVNFKYEVDGNNLVDLVASDYMSEKGIIAFAIEQIEYADNDCVVSEKVRITQQPSVNVRQNRKNRKEYLRKILNQQMTALCMTVDLFHNDSIECPQDSAVFHLENIDNDDYASVFEQLSFALTDKI